jgi:DNA repair exonuclease SbcCD ATPase subunit
MVLNLSSITIIEQMQTKTKISSKIRQLVSGSERADYTKVAETLEFELETITKDIPGRGLRKKREIEKCDERISELSRAIADAQENLVASCQLEAQIQAVEDEDKESKSELDKKRDSLEALGKYIQVEKDLSDNQRSLRLLQDQIATLQEITVKIDSGRVRSGSFKVPLIIGVAGVVISVVLWLILKNLLLTMGILVLGILLSVAFHFYSIWSGTSSKGIEINERHREDVENELDRLKQEMFSLHTLKESIRDQYPSFMQADMNTLLTVQEDMNQDQKILKEKIEDKEDELYNLRVKLGTIERNVIDFHSWEEEKKILEENRKYLQRRKEALLTAISVLQECIREYQFRYIEELESYMTGAFRKITDKRYESVILEENTLEPLVSMSSKSHIRKESLSIGTLEQLYFAMRLSMAYLLSSDVTLPFLLDDSFVSYDDSRLDNIRYILSRVKQKNQIILFVHDSFYKEWADTVIDLNRHHE